MTVEKLVYTGTMAGYVYFHDKSLADFVLNILASESRNGINMCHVL